MHHDLDPLPMACERFEDQLNEYADGELAFDVQAELFRHLAGCERCRRYLESVVAVRRIVADEPLQLPPAYDEAFLHRLASHREAVSRAKQRTERRDRLHAAIPTAGRAAVLTLVLGLVVGNILKNEPHQTAISRDVVAEEELVNFPTVRNVTTHFAPVYVFYPGLTVEADNWVEPIATDPL